MVSAPDARLISIVDDDESVREAITSLLRSAGFQAKSFASAEKFLHSPVLQETACLILDVRMPGASGPELQRRLATESRRIPIIFITPMVIRVCRQGLCAQARSTSCPNHSARKRSFALFIQAWGTHPGTKISKEQNK